MPVPPQEPFWSTAFAVGDKPWLRGLTAGDEKLDDLIMPADDAVNAEEGYDGTWLLHATRRVAKRLMQRINR